MSEREPCDARLDEALRLLHRAERDSEGSLSETRERVLAAARAENRTVERVEVNRARRRWLPAVAAAAAVLMLLALVPLAASQWDEQPRRPTAPVANAPGQQSARDVLERAARAAAGVSANAPKPWYRYIIEHDVSYGVDRAAQTRKVRELWVPPNPQDQWRLIDSDVQVHTSGTTAARAREQGIPNIEARANCGRFVEYPEIDCTDPGSAYSDAFYAGLPTEGPALLDALRAKLGGPGTDVWAAASEVLRTGMAPREVRAALYRGLAGLPGIHVAEQRAVLGERTGVALGVERAGEPETRTELVVDPDTGEFLGTRTRSADGRLLRARAVTVAAVGDITARPGS